MSKPEEKPKKEEKIKKESDKPKIEIYPNVLQHEEFNDILCDVDGKTFYDLVYKKN